MNQEKIIEEIEKELIENIAQKTLYALRKTKVTLSGDDSELENAWDEFCVQVQIEQSFFWEAYEGLAESIIQQHLSQLKLHEIAAIWLQTEEGFDWQHTPVIVEDTGENKLEEGELPICNDDVERIIKNRLFDIADSYTNAKIRKYMERKY